MAIDMPTKESDYEVRQEVYLQDPMTQTNLSEYDEPVIEVQLTCPAQARVYTCNNHHKCDGGQRANRNQIRPRFVRIGQHGPSGSSIGHSDGLVELLDLSLEVECKEDRPRRLTESTELIVNA